VFKLALGIPRTVAAVSVFVLGALAILLTQLIGSIVGIYGAEEFLHAWMANTKSSFIVLLTMVLNIVGTSRIHLKLIGSRKLPDHAFKKDQRTGQVTSLLASNSVIIGNHQIYIEWAFVWFWLHTAGLSGFIYIMLKDSLKRIPLLGYGMVNYDFIFLTRKWVTDKVIMNGHLERMDANGRGLGPASGVTKVDGNGEGGWPPVGVRGDKTWPYSLVIFPEGTNLSDNTRKKTEAYAAKAGRKPFRNVLLPRTTGLRYSLLKLRGSVQEVYDLTIGYSGVKQDEYGQDIYRLDKVFLEGKNPEKVEFYVDSYKLDEIPLGELEYEDEESEAVAVKEFEDWLFEVWEKKDKLLDGFYKDGSFVTAENKNKDLNVVDVDFAVGYLEFLNIFAVPVIVLFLIKLIYTGFTTIWK
jgi:1-acyl-sn-glycerol-3-phosphate acyltransferase